MRKLMQHLLNGGKLVDEQGYTVGIVKDTRTIDVRDKTGKVQTALATQLGLITYLAEHDFKPLYTNGLYEVQYNKDDSRSSFLSRTASKWVSVYYYPATEMSEPHRIIRKLEPQELEL